MQYVVLKVDVTGKRLVHLADKDRVRQVHASDAITPRVG